jgi:hypothetical protein
MGRQDVRWQPARMYVTPPSLPPLSQPRPHPAAPTRRVGMRAVASRPGWCLARGWPPGHAPVSRPVRQPRVALPCPPAPGPRTAGRPARPRTCAPGRSSPAVVWEVRGRGRGGDGWAGCDSAAERIHASPDGGRAASSPLLPALTSSHPPTFPTPPCPFPGCCDRRKALRRARGAGFRCGHVWHPDPPFNDTHPAPNPHRLQRPT